MTNNTQHIAPATVIMALTMLPPKEAVLNEVITIIAEQIEHFSVHDLASIRTAALRHGEGVARMIDSALDGAIVQMKINSPNWH